MRSRLYIGQSQIEFSDLAELIQTENKMFLGLYINLNKVMINRDCN